MLFLTPHNLEASTQWIDAYPGATSYVCPGGKAKFPDIPYDQEIANLAPPEWLGEVRTLPPLDGRDSGRDW